MVILTEKDNFLQSKMVYTIAEGDYKMMIFDKD